MGLIGQPAQRGLDPITHDQLRARQQAREDQPNGLDRHLHKWHDITDCTMPLMSAPGRRERKKAATRRAIADAALRLFLAKGYDGVTVREIAEAADVSATTLLKHFPSKEALAFDEEAEIETGLVAAVRQRAPGVTIPRALCAYIAERRKSAGTDDPRFPQFLALVRATPALADYAHRMWTRHQDALAAAIADDVGAPAADPHAQALARFALDSTALAHRSPDPERALAAAFDLLDHGWSGRG